MIDPNVRATLHVSVYADGSLVHVVGPPVQFANGGFEHRAPQGKLLAVYEIDGGFIPAMPHALNGEVELEKWIKSLKSQGLQVSKVS